MMTSTLLITLTVIRAFVACIHMIGFYLLYKSYRSSLCGSQRLYLMNFSITEIFLCLFDVIKRICQLINENNIQNYILIIQWTGLSLGYYLAMILLTMDRFLKFMLDIKYVTVWTRQRTKLSIIVSWIICLITVIFCLYYIPKDHVIISRLATLYFFSTFDFTFVILAVLSYGSLFKTLHHVKLRQRRLSMPVIRSPSTLSSKTNLLRRKSIAAVAVKKIREKTAFNVLFIPTWIIITFLLFIMLPDQIYFYCFLLEKDIGHLGDIIISFTYSLGFISDALIYIFLSQPVRKTLMRLIRRQLHGRRETNFPNDESKSSCNRRMIVTEDGMNDSQYLGQTLSIRRINGIIKS